VDTASENHHSDITIVINKKWTSPVNIIIVTSVTVCLFVPLFHRKMSYNLVPPPNYNFSSVPPPRSIPLRTTFKTPPILYINHILLESFTDIQAKYAAKFLSQNRNQNTEINTVFEDPEIFRSGHDTRRNISFIVGIKRVKTYRVEKIENTWRVDNDIVDTFPIFECVVTETGQIIYHFNSKLYQEKQKQYDRRTIPPSRLGPVNRFNTPYRRR
jgi:hypothetical protein